MPVNLLAKNTITVMHPDLGENYFITSNGRCALSDTLQPFSTSNLKELNGPSLYDDELASCARALAKNTSLEVLRHPGNLITVEVGMP